MKQRKNVSYAVRMLLNQMRRFSENHLPYDAEIPPAQGRLIGYVKHHPDRDIYQRDLEQEFQIRRSTASALLKSMERNDLIRRVPVPQDARLKKLILTPRAEAFSQKVEEEIARREAQITQGVSEEEMTAFFATIAKFEENLKRGAGEPEADCQCREEKEC